VYLRLLGPLRSVIAGVLQATSLTFIVAATQIGLGLGVVSRASAAALVAAGLLSVAISPTLALVLLRRTQPGAAAPEDSPSPMMPVITAADRALTRVEHAPSAP
jgi:Kef-type K+ transport system membrane component KefB